MIKTIIFDLGGVLVSDAPLYYVNHLCDFSSVLNFAGVSKEEVSVLWKKHWPKLKLGEEEIAVFWKEFAKLMTNNVNLNEVIKKYEERIIMDQEMKVFISKLKSKYNLLALANESKEGIDLKIAKFNLNDLFEKIYCSGYLGMAKPNKEIYEFVIKDAKIDLTTTIFVDNQMKNVKMAESVGIKSIFFTDLKQLKQDFSKLGIKS